MTKLKIRQFVPAKYDSPILSHIKLPAGKKMQFVLDKYELPAHVVKDGMINKDNDISFEIAGARKKVFFRPEETRAAIVTCGGLCPGLNDVIWGIVLSLFYWYDVKDIIGIKYGYSGLAASPKYNPIPLDPDLVSAVHDEGGSFLGTSRGNPPVEEMVDSLVRLKVNILFCIGGDGTLRGAHSISEEIKKRKLQISIIGVPKTIDNDIYYVERSFGFHTAIEEARKVLNCAHVESKGADNGIGLVKLMGRDAGYIAANATKASGNVNYCLIPEIKFPFYEPGGLLDNLKSRFSRKNHAVIAIAEGAGVHLIGKGEKKDAGGNTIHNDIGIFLKDEIKKFFATLGITMNIKYFDPSYIIRSVPASGDDSIFCSDLARFAVHAGMAGKTDMLIGYSNGYFTHVPLAAINGRKKQIDAFGERLWGTVIATTGQPAEWH